MFPISLTSKRAKLALRFFSYGVMTLATVLLTTLAIFYAMGYRFNKDTFTFEQGGLVQFRTTPEGAKVTIDGKQQNFTTPGRANLPSGPHAIAMQATGFRSWSKGIDLDPGQLLWVNYVRLVPNSITTLPLRSFTQLQAMLSSPDKRWLLLQEVATQPNFTLADAGNEHSLVFTTLALPDAQLSKPIGTLVATEWDLSSRYILVHHTGQNIDEWLRVDRSAPANTINVSKLFGLPITSAHFSGSNPDVLYGVSNGVLRRYDITAKTTSAGLVNGVTYFTIYGNDVVTYVANQQAVVGNPASAQQVVGIVRNDKNAVVQTAPVNVAVNVAYGEYDNHAYLAVRKGNEKIQVLRDPSVAAAKDTTVFATVDVTSPLDQMLFSNNSRMLLARSGKLLTTYDLEVAKTYSQPLNYLDVTGPRNLQWLDDYYLWSDTNSRLRWVEFDGQNDRELTSVAPGFSVTLSQTGKTVFSIGKNAITGDYFLQSTDLTIKP